MNVVLIGLRVNYCWKYSGLCRVVVVVLRLMLGESFLWLMVCLSAVCIGVVCYICRWLWMLVILGLCLVVFMIDGMIVD